MFRECGVWPNISKILSFGNLFSKWLCRKTVTQYITKSTECPSMVEDLWCCGPVSLPDAVEILSACMASCLTYQSILDFQQSGGFSLETEITLSQIEVQNISPNSQRNGSKISPSTVPALSSYRKRWILCRSPFLFKAFHIFLPEVTINVAFMCKITGSFCAKSSTFRGVLFLPMEIIH